MKKIVVLLLAAMMSIGASAEIMKLKCTHFASRKLTSSNTWTDWTDWRSSSDIIVLNGEKNKITINGSKNEGYDIISSEQYTDEDGDEWISMDSVDDEGYRCDVQIRFAVDGEIQLYVKYEALQWVYSVDIL